MHISCAEGSPHWLQILKSSFCVVCSIAGLSFSITFDTVNFVPVCFSSILFSIARMSFLNASEAYGHGVSWKGIFFMYAYSALSFSGISQNGFIFWMSCGCTSLVTGFSLAKRAMSPLKMFMRNVWVSSSSVCAVAIFVAFTCLAPMFNALLRSTPQ